MLQGSCYRFDYYLLLTSDHLQEVLALQSFGSNGIDIIIVETAARYTLGALQPWQV